MKEIVLPELAESVIEGEILKWLVAEGDLIALEQPLCEVMTDKVTVELPSTAAGVLTKRLAAEGDIVAVHAVIALIDDAAGAAAGAAALPSDSQAIQDSSENPASSHTPLVDQPPLADHTREKSEQPGAISAEAAQSAKADDDSTSLFKTFANDEQVQVQGLGVRTSTPAPAQASTQPHTHNSAQTSQTAGRVLAVPAARQLARELGVDLTRVLGSGPNGRIRVHDVLAQQATPTTPAAVTPPVAVIPAPAPVLMPTPQAPAKSQAAPFPSGVATGVTAGFPAPVPYRTPKGYEHLEARVPLRGMRRAISNQMWASHLYTVRTLTVDEVNMTQLVEFRSRVKDEARAAGVKLSYLPFIFKAVAVALRKYPSLNTSFDESTQEIVQKRYYHMGMAVATEAGLTVPVIRDVNQKSVFELAREVVDLAARAGTGKLEMDELSGSSFSITNIGSIGALFTFPIINVPDAAILGIHSIVKRPIVDADDNIVVAHMMYLSLSFDHRLVDGAEAARFCKEVIRLLENPERLMLEAM